MAEIQPREFQWVGLEPRGATGLQVVRGISQIGRLWTICLKVSESVINLSSRQRPPVQIQICNKQLHVDFTAPHLIYGILHGRISKEIKELTKNATEDVKLYFSRQVFDIIVQIIKTSIALIRRRFVGSKGSKKGSSMFFSGNYAATHIYKYACK